MIYLRTGPQREIFPGGAKIDAGPPNSREAEKKGLHSNLVKISPKLSEDQKKKRSSPKFGLILCPKFGPKDERQEQNNLVQNLTQQPKSFRARVRCTP